MLQRNIKHYLKKRIYEKLEMSEMKQLNFCFYSQQSVFDFSTNMNPRLYILFMVNKYMTEIMNMF